MIPSLMRGTYSFKGTTLSLNTFAILLHSIQVSTLHKGIFSHIVCYKRKEWAPNGETPIQKLIGV